MNKPTVFSETFSAMGTRCDVVITGVEHELAEQAFQIIKAETNQLEKQLSRFINNSAISFLNQTKKNIWVEVEDEIWDILTICHDFYLMSNGAFDITAAALISLWKNKEIVSEKDLETARQKSGFDKVEFDFENQKLQFLVDGVEFDLGAIGKGIVIDTIKPILLKQGINNAIVSFGESSILALGNHPNGNYWPLGIRNQNTKEEYVHVFNACNEVVTTSGTLFTDDSGRLAKRNHIVSPATGKVIESNTTISVKSESATMGEFISTTWLILPEEDKNILADKLKGLEILEVSYLNDEVKTKLSVLGDIK